MRSVLQHLRVPRESVAPGRLPGAAAGPGSDLLARLPIELHIILLEYLSQEDILVALHSSKILRLIWLSEDIWPRLAERWHPGLSSALREEAARHSTNDGRDKEQESGVADSLELLRRRLQRLSTRTNGKYASKLHHSLQFLNDPFFSRSKQVSRGHGGIHSEDHLEPDLVESLQNPSHVSRFMVYNHGRIAWWPDVWTAPYIAVVDDLRTAKRRVYEFPDHGNERKGYKTAVSDQLLVLGREHHLHAWHFARNVLASVVVPELFDRCIAEGSLVLILSRSSEVYRWKFAEKLERLSFGSLGCYQPGPIMVGGLFEALGVIEPPLQTNQPPFHITRRHGLVFKDTGMLLDFIVHPQHAHVVFVVTMHDGQLIVHEVDHGKLVQSYHLHDGSSSSKTQWKQINEYLRWEKCDSYGGYRLMYAYLGSQHPLSPADLQRPEEPWCTCNALTGLISVCFNIHTRSFKVQCHHFLHKGPDDRHHLLFLDPEPAAFHLWDSKLYTSYESHSMRHGMPMTALKCCLKSQEMASRDPPIYTMSESSRGILSRRFVLPASTSRSMIVPDVSGEDVPGLSDFLTGDAATRASWQTKVCFCLDVTDFYAPESGRSEAKNLWKWGGHHSLQTIIGDDDFLIYVVDGVYNAWSFGDEIPVPKDGPVTKKWMPWQRT